MQEEAGLRGWDQQVVSKRRETDTADYTTVFWITNSAPTGNEVPAATLENVKTLFQSSVICSNEKGIPRRTGQQEELGKGKTDIWLKSEVCLPATSKHKAEGQNHRLTELQKLNLLTTDSWKLSMKHMRRIKET